LKRPRDLTIDLTNARVLTTQVPPGVLAGDPAKPAGPAPKASKYRNVRIEYRGVMYDSKAEAGRAELLDGPSATAS
jgi:hypothetical protein